MKLLVLVFALTLTLVQLSSSKPRHNGRITGGEEVEPHSIPYQAALFMDVAGVTYFCGGSLISAKAVLTAANCAANAHSIQVVLGAHKVTEDEDTQVKVKASRIRVHPDYDSVDITNDLAILILPQDMELNDNIQIISLPTSNDNNYEGDLATVSGWGFDSDYANAISPVLRKVQIPVMSNKDCNQFYVSLILDSNICGSGDGGKATCNGDSGGPLVASTGEQIGIASFGILFGCEIGFPSAFTRVSSYLDWINENMK